MRFTEDQLSLQQMAREFAEKELMPRAAEMDIDGELPMDVYQKAVDMSLTCLDLPEEYGGAGLDMVTTCLIREEISRGDSGFSITIGSNSLGFKPVGIAGNEEQKQHFADIITRGGFCAFAITEPGSGSDAASTATTAVKVGDEYIINGRKCFITNAERADVYTVLATTDKTKGARGLSMFIVDRDTPGVSTGKHEDKMGIRVSNTADVIFEDVHIPAKNLIGQEGKGFKIAMQTLEKGRVITGAAAVGIGRAALEYATKYAQVRKTMGQPICEHGQIQALIADTGIELEAARQLVLAAADAIDHNDPNKGKLSAMSKCFAAEVIERVCSHAIQILGGYGYMRDYPVEKLYRDARIYQIFEGTNQIQRLVIARAMLKENPAD